MALFTQDIRPTNDPNYLGYSKEPDKQQSNKALGSLFGDIGDLVGPMVNAVDSNITQSMTNRARELIEPKRDPDNLGLEDVQKLAGTGTRGASQEAGVEDITAGGDTAGPPEGAKDRLDKLSRLKAAFKAGERSNTYYNTELVSIVSQLRAEYPGYTDQIDAAVQKITGVNPANELRRNKLADLVSSERAALSQQQKAYTTWHGDQAYIQQVKPGSDFNYYQQNRSEIDVRVGLLKARDQNITSQEKALDLKSKQAANDSKEDERLFSTVAGEPVQRFISGAMTKLQEDGEKLKAQGVNADPQKVQELAMRIEDSRVAIRRNLFNKANEVREIAPGKYAPSYVERLGIERVTQIIDGQLSPLKDIHEMYSQKNGDGIAKLAANVVQHQNDQDVIAVRKVAPGAGVVNGMRQLVGNEGASIVFQRSTVLNDVVKAANNAAVVGIATSKPGEAPSIDQVLDAMPQSQRGKNTKIILQQLKDLSVNSDPEVAKNAIDSLYKSNRFFAELSQKDQDTVYKTLGDPAFTRKMVEIGGDSWQQYSNWMERNFSVVGVNAIATLQKDMVQYNRFDTKFHPDSFQFSAEPKAGYKTDTRPSLGGISSEGDPTSYANSALGPINAYLKQIQPVLQEKYGADAPRKLVDLLKKQGYNPDAPKAGNTLEQIGDAIWRGIGVDPADVRMKPKDPEPPAPEKPIVPQKLPGPEGLMQRRSETLGPKYTLQEETVNDIAKQFVGLSEVSDRTVLAAFIKKGTGRNVDPAEEPWCADFLNSLLSTAGEKGTDSRAARSFLNYGKPVAKGTEGDIVVFSRGSDPEKGHVGLVQGYVKHGKEEYVKVLGGNQGNRVSVQEYPVSRVLGYRRVSSADMQKYAEAEGNFPTAAA